MMTTFLIITAILFALSALSNSVYIAGDFSDKKTSSVVGLVIYTSMFVWNVSLIFNQYANG